jgi:hypothetical protein
MGTLFCPISYIQAFFGYKESGSLFAEKPLRSPAAKALALNAENGLDK